MGRHPRHDPMGLEGTIVDGKYRVGKAIGEGGFSVVYRAEHRLWRQPIAIKFFKVVATSSAAQQKELFEDFVLEGKLMTELSSRCPGIVQARDVGTVTTKDGRWFPFMVLEWLDGLPLDKLLREEREREETPRTLKEAMSLLEPAAVALDVVHEAGVAHRDVKPANIFVLDIEPNVKLLDFGVAKVMAERKELATSMFQTGKELTAFTPKYGAPEQFDRSWGPTGPWTDVYAMALILVELIAGRRALDGTDYLELAAASRATERPTPTAMGVAVSAEVEQVFRRALAVEPTDRYRSLGAMWSALHRAVFPDKPEWTAGIGRAASAIASSPPRVHTLPGGSARTLSRPPKRQRRRLRWTWVAGAAASLGVGGLVAWGLLGAARTQAPARIDRRQEGTPMRTPEAATECPPDMTRVPEATLSLGSRDPERAGSSPVRQVHIAAFCIDLHEVTVRDYRTCSDQGECKRADAMPNLAAGSARKDDDGARIASAELCNAGKEGRDEHPINCISWERASAYCAFREKRLPTDAEWEYAARGTEGTRFPWGDEPASARRMNACGPECGAWRVAHGLARGEPIFDLDDGNAGTAPVGSYPEGRTRFGAFDMFGNVWEWTSGSEGIGE